MYDTIIIGGGYAGLTCGVALAKAGQRVCVLEKGRVLGGAFQCFRRGGMQFDTGFHYVGGVAEGEMMHPMLERFGLADLPWVRLDDDFIEAHLDGETYRLCCGYDRFAQRLKERFPSESSGIDELVATMRDIAEHIYQSVENTSGYENKLMQIAAKAWIDEHFNDSRLKKLLCANAVTTDLTAELPLYSFTQSLNSFIHHTYRIKGGGNTIISRLRDNITSLGGEVYTGCEVMAMHAGGNGGITSVECADGSVFRAKQFISTIHPAKSVALMPECTQIRGIYRRRFLRMPNTRGIFTVQLAVKPGTVPYRNRVISVIGSPDPWNTDYRAVAPVENLLINFNVPQHPDTMYADNIDLLTPMEYSAVEPWADSRLGHRPDDYRTFKNAKAKECIKLASKYIPNLEENIAAVYTSTPLTYRDYTGTVGGSAYGISKSASAIAGGMLSPTTPFGNLFFAGQSLMLHGMLGVGMTSLLVTNIVSKFNLNG